MSDKREQAPPPPSPRRRGLLETIAEKQRSIRSKKELEATIARLESDSCLSTARAESLRKSLPATIDASTYVLKHLGAHLAIGAFFAFDVIPLPLGTICRVAWVAGARVYETVFGSAEQARIHSLPVLALAAVPLLGYAAYLIPLRRVSNEASYIYANHLAYALRQKNFEEVMASKPRFIRRAAARLVPSRLLEDSRPR